MSTPAPVFHLVIHSGYHNLFIGLYNHDQNLAIETLDKKTVSAFLMPSILELLKHHELTFKDLSFIGVHSGPAPFTTLRVGIATANGIGFATQLPLIPISGLQELSRIYPDYTVILNAFCDDVYIGKNGELSCENIDTFLQQQAICATAPITYIGNAVPLHHKKIQDTMGTKVHFLHEYPYEASLEMVAHAAYTQWLKKENLSTQVIPTYLKQYSAKIAN